MSSSSTANIFKRLDKKRIIKIETVHCSLYDYMVLDEIADIGSIKNNNENKQKYYENAYGNELISTIQQRDGFFFKQFIRFSEYLGLSFKDILDDTNNLIIIPIFIGEDNFEKKPSSLIDFFKDNKYIKKCFGTITDIILEEAASEVEQANVIAAESANFAENAARDAANTNLAAAARRRAADDARRFADNASRAADKARRVAEPLPTAAAASIIADARRAADNASRAANAIGFARHAVNAAKFARRADNSAATSSQSQNPKVKRKKKTKVMKGGTVKTNKSNYIYTDIFSEMYRKFFPLHNDDYLSKLKYKFYFLPCILKKSNKRIKTEKDYIEELQKEIYIFRRFLDNNGKNFDKIQIFVDPDDKISTKFYEEEEKKKKNTETQSNISIYEIDYLNKHLIQTLKSSVDQNNIFKHLFDQFIEKTKKHPLYSLSPDKLKSYSKLYYHRNNIDIHLGKQMNRIFSVANEIIKWLILGGKKPDYNLKSEVLKIFCKEIIPTNIFSFKIDSTKTYEFYYYHFDKNSEKSFEFTFDRTPVSKKKIMKSDNKNKKDQQKKHSIPYGYLKIRKKSDQQPSSLYIKLKYSDFDLIEGTLYTKTSDGTYNKITKKGKEGIVRRKPDDSKYLPYDASKLNRNKKKSDNMVRYLKNFSITPGNLKGFLLNEESYIKELPLSSQLANILADNSLLNNFYNFCSSSPEYSKSIKSDINSVNSIIKGIISILFSKNTPFFVNSIISPNTLTKSYDSTSTSSTYFIQKYSIKKFSLPKKPLNLDEIPEIESHRHDIDPSKEAFVLVDLILSNKKKAKSKSCKERKESILNKTMKILKAVVKNFTFKLRTSKNLLESESI